jgi:hypothetical protein
MSGEMGLPEHALGQERHRSRTDTGAVIRDYTGVVRVSVQSLPGA